MPVGSLPRIGREILEGALRLEPSQRHDYVKRACSDPELRQRLLGWLEPATARAIGSRERTATGPDAGSRGGDVLAGRYRIGRFLGRGASGSVWAASDLRSGDDVAVKFLERLSDEQLTVVRREIAMLRLLRLPGVVQMRDEGTVEGAPFIVMDLVLGTPFGAGAPLRWEDLETSALMLLEVVDRIHWAGILHRDLKSENVLVAGDGRPTVLDLGTAAERETDDPWAVASAVEGTPLFLAPERLRGRRASVASDVYSLGAMFYEALTGAPPHAEESLLSFVAARLGTAAPPIRRIAPSVPEAVARVIDRLLDPDPTRRPRSAGEVRSLLSAAGRGAAGSAPRLPWLGDDEAVRRLHAAASERRSIDLHGSPGSGRTHALDELERRLVRDGRRVLRLVEGNAPWESARNVVGDTGGRDWASADEAAAHVEAAVASALAAGAVIVADDVDQLDAWTRRDLARWRIHGCIVQSSGLSTPAPGEPVLRALSARDLQSAFLGEDRLFHAREDAADVLHERTGGHAARVVQELEAWIRMGLARREGDRVVPTPEGLSRLRAGFRVGRGAGPPPSSIALPAGLAEAAACVDVAGPAASESAVARLTDRPAWQVEAEVEELVRRGILHRRHGGGLDSVLPARSLVEWPDDRWTRLHGRMADLLAPGSDGRLEHLLAAGLREEVPGEALLVARRLRDEGRVGEAQAAVTEGLLAIRDGRADREAELLHALVDLALMDGTARILDNALYRLGRAHVRTRDVEMLECVARAALLALAGEPERALEALSGPPFPATSEERRLATTVRALAARYLPADREARIIEEALSEAGADQSSRWQASANAWVGWLRYREGRFEEAARHHSAAALRATSRVSRISSLLNAASAWLESGRYDEAEAAARESLELAARCRHPLHEARAEWLLRALAYRRGDDVAPDLDLVRAAGGLGARNVEAMILLNEAAVAWRRDDLATGRDLAVRAARDWAAIGREDARDLSHALALACGAPTGPEGCESLLERAAASPVAGVALQTLGLLAGAQPHLAARCADAVGRRAAEIPESDRNRRREVMTITEAMAAAARPEGGMP